MMDIKLKVCNNKTEIPVNQALERKLIVLGNSTIETNNNTTLHLSTGILDSTGKEIFEGDVIEDKKGNRFLIHYQSGAFLAVRNNHKNGYEVKDRIPIYYLQSNNSIPAKILYEE